MDECVKNNYTHKLRVFIPSDLNHYIADYHKNWCESPVTEKDISALEVVLRAIHEKNPSALLEMKHEGGRHHSRSL